MDFREANELLYKGYLYQLIVVVMVAFIEGLYVVALLAARDPVPLFWPIATFLAAFLVVVFVVYLLFIWYRYIYRGYIALHRMGVRWAFWLAWGPVIEMVLAGTLVAVLFAILPPAADRDVPVAGEPNFLDILMALAPLFALLIILFVFGVFLNIAHILFLNNMRSITNLSKFGTASTLLIIVLVLYFVSLVFPIAGIVVVLLGLAEYIIEMLAYKEASVAPPPASLGTPGE